MSSRGFTLVEMVLTLIVGSILVLGIAGFVELGTKGYADSVDRQRIQTQAQFVLEKLSREFRHAVPNSFSGSGNCLFFLSNCLFGLLRRERQRYSIFDRQYECHATVG